LQIDCQSLWLLFFTFLTVFPEFHEETDSTPAFTTIISMNEINRAPFAREQLVRKQNININVPAT
jgi:hypothetical protein